MSTPNLNLAHITASQNNKEITANNAFNGLDNAMNRPLEITISGDRTITSSEFRGYSTFKLSGSPGTGFTLTVPGINRVFSVINLTTQACTIEADGTGGVQLNSGTGGVLASDGSDVYLVSSGSLSGGGAGTNIPYDLAAFVAERPLDDEIIFRFVAVREVTIPESYSGSKASAAVAADEPAVFSIQKNGTVVGSIDFYHSAEGIFSQQGPGGDITLAAGDVLTIHAPEYQDSTLYDVAITISAMV